MLHKIVGHVVEGMGRKLCPPWPRVGEAREARVLFMSFPSFAVALRSPPPPFPIISCFVYVQLAFVVVEPSMVMTAREKLFFIHLHVGCSRFCLRQGSYVVVVFRAKMYIKTACFKVLFWFSCWLFGESLGTSERTARRRRRRRCPRCLPRGMFANVTSPANASF